MRIARKNIALICLSVVWLVLASGSIFAQQNNADRSFSLQVTPSPIVETIKPGVTQTSELKIRNGAPQAETLKMGLQSFKFNETTGEIELLDEEPAEVKDWVTFANPVFTVNAGTVFNQKINIATPADAGFSYYFAVTIRRAVSPAPVGGQQALEGSVAVFTLLSVDRPDAKRSFKIAEFSSKKRVYEYLPAYFDLKIENTGNTIIKPGGNVYIQRSSNSTKPISVLPANPAGSFILPDTYRVLTIVWEDGFPVYKNISEADNVESKKRLTWNWGKASEFRIGKYVAKVVAIYNDGQRDVPVQAEVSFWVIPWKILLGFFVLAALVFIGFASMTRGLLKLGNRGKKSQKKAPEKAEPKDDDKSEE